ncbi:SRPBCC family protein [Microlunatus soli]|uniref:Uncharacterized conserved protein YndB, AHSA1/START domain n=1 Tax=Microlunatus soli TaxID=630515 RepID=A0A1H1QEX4_9ACTN|nr:SRPBCC family protein [Microlunatus soli]SDS22032.1 Uncharacterized conserved protein YndB, AHSA1/START domain [Microlunatus soli]
MNTRTRQDFDPGPLKPATISPAGGRWTLVYRQQFNHSPQAVWAALTDPDQLSAWAPYTADRDLGSTGPATLIMIDGPDRKRLPATVIVADRPAVLEFDWGGQLLRWELQPTTDGTELVLQHTVDERDSLSSMAAGWHLCLLVADAALRGEPFGPITGEAAKEYGWDDLERGYAAEFGRHDTAG